MSGRSSIDGVASVDGVSSIDGAAHVEVLRGVDADPNATPDLLVEVPHGADRRAHYDALRERMVGALPDELEVFFFANTDVGAWDLGRRVAERVIAADPRRSALLIRCLVPRTFVDTNRLAEATDDLAAGGMTAGVPAYVTHDDDRRLLLAMHSEYVALVDRAFELVCGSGGFAVLPHTYGPRTMDISRVDETIVTALRAAAAPDVWAASPLRPEVDLITKDPAGASFAPAGMPEAIIDAYRALGVTAVDSETYTLHPKTQGARHATTYPGQTICLEVRRDLLTVERFERFEELTVDLPAVNRLAGPLADAVAGWFARRDG